MMSESTGFQIVSPIDGSVFAERVFATPEQIRHTLGQAQHAAASWRDTSLEHRMELCLKAVEYAVTHADTWGEELTRMMGRPIRYTPNEIRGGFQERARYMIQVAPQALRDLPAREKAGFQRFIRREPLGTVLVLAPWNYPYLTSVNVIIPALLAGNTVILKHAEQTALVAERYLEAFRAAGLPEGVFQFLHLTHDQVAEVMADPIINYVAFTGSVEGGHAIQQSTGKRFITAGLELGGKDPAYICTDADWQYTIENVVDGVFFNSGQSCCAIERIYVQQEIFADFVHDFVALTKKYILGNPLEHTTTLGPMVRISNAQRALAQIEAALNMGAMPHIQASDFPVLPLPYVAPQVLTNVDHRMDVMWRESFAPVIGIMPVRDETEAIRLMNDSPYGLTASIWTRDPDRALAIGDRIATGTWFMNRCDYLDPELPWTGIKDSGKGCTLSPLGFEHLTRPKSFHLKIQTS